MPLEGWDGNVPLPLLLLLLLPAPHSHASTIRRPTENTVSKKFRPINYFHKKKSAKILAREGFSQKILPDYRVSLARTPKRATRHFCSITSVNYPTANPFVEFC